MYMCVRAINLAFFVVVDFIRIWNCSNTVIVLFLDIFVSFQVANTKFYICIVLGDNSHSEISESQFPLSLDKLKDSFMYHDRSLASDSFQDCRFNSRKVTLGK